MAEFVISKEKSVKVGEKVGIQSDIQIPFEVKKNGLTTNVAFNKDGEYLVSIFDGKVIVTTLNHR